MLTPAIVASTPRVTRTPGHWYHVTYFDCPVCGRGDVIRERRSPPKPAEPAQRVEFVEQYDWCDAL